MVHRVLLDSTYLLPTFGIDVEGLSDDDIRILRELGLGRVRYYCLSVVWVEVLGKVHKEAVRRNITLGEWVNVAIESLLNSGFYDWIYPSSSALKLALELRQKGHRDMIDNLLYGSAISEGMIFLTMDTTFLDFLKRNGYSVDNVFDHVKLIQIMSK